MSDPFSTESHEALTQRLWQGVCPPGGGHGWKDRAQEALAALLTVLVHLRDTAGQPLNLIRVRENFLLASLVDLARRPDLPTEVVEPLRAYLRSLPGFTASAAHGAPLSEVAQEQHGHLYMQFVKAWNAGATSAVHA